MKKILSLLCLLAFSLSFCIACAPQTEGFKVVCTNFAAYDWAKAVIGNTGATVSMLSENGADMHNYEPTAAHLAKISDCDVFIYTGGSSEAWVEKALRNPKNKDRQVLCLSDALGPDNLLCTGHDHSAHAHHDDFDEHIWLSLPFAMTLTAKIADTLSLADPENAETYAANATSYTASLQTLHLRMQSAVENASKDTLVFADRFPFLYFVRDYGLSYAAAGEGCSTETSATPNTLISLAKVADEKGISVLLVIDGSDEAVARGVIACASDKNKQILTLNSMQSISKKDMEANVTYLSIFEQNIAVLEAALS